MNCAVKVTVFDLFNTARTVSHMGLYLLLFRVNVAHTCTSREIVVVA